MHTDGLRIDVDLGPNEAPNSVFRGAVIMVALSCH